MAAADRLVLSKEGLKHGRHLGRFSFEAIESKATSREITLICDTGVINRNNSPGQPLFYTASDICVFKARERRPCMWFTLPAKTFFTEFQPWFARVKGAALAHEYDEPEDSDEDFVSNGDESSDEQGDAEVLTLSEPGVKHGNLRGRFPFRYAPFHRTGSPAPHPRSDFDTLKRAVAPLVAKLFTVHRRENSRLDVP
mmetsp:Transcript_22021/g.66052  ORF Transcript_22021/g.66052 Transcript_22021/m.66052 type:complete len:197 (-) Transcript_22021:1789-2379(-)